MHSWASYLMSLSLSDIVSNWTLCSMFHKVVLRITCVYLCKLLDTVLLNRLLMLLLKIIILTQSCVVSAQADLGVQASHPVPSSKCQRRHRQSRNRSLAKGLQDFLSTGAVVFLEFRACSTGVHADSPSTPPGKVVCGAGRNLHITVQ